MLKQRFPSLQFSSHIQTYDMSEAVEVEPRAQEYRAGIKWEFRILVKREDVILATDDIASRKAWIDALTSILGKVSMATHSELQSRVTTADQMNRELQASVDNLKAENQQLRDELAAVQDRLKEELEAMYDKNEAREKELDEMDTQYELLRRELSIWRNKTNMLESQLTKKEQECLDTQKEMEEWRKKATELEQAAQEEQDDTRTVKDTIKDVKFSLNSLRDAIKMHSDSQPLVQGHIMDMKSGITKLSDILQEAKSGWTELQAEMTQFMETSKERQTATAALQENNAQESNNTTTSSSRIDEKLNDMLQMMEMLQLSQTRLMTTTMEYVEEERKGIHIDDTRMEAIQSMIQDIQTMLVNNNSQDDGKEEEERQDKFESENRMVEMNEKLEKLLELGKLLQESQDQARQENEKGVDVMGQLFNHIIAQLESSSAVSEQLEQIQERLTSIKAMQETQQKQRLTNGNNAVRTNDAVADAVGNIATSSSAAEELEEMMQSTRGLVERTLRILDKFNSSHMEETVRRAVKTAFNSHWRDVNNNSSSNKSNDESNQQLKRYEENAREYFDKSMSNMRDHLEEYTGVMYRMIEDLILRAVEHLDQSSSSSHATERKQPLQQQQQQQEHEQLDKQLAEKKMALKALEAEYEAVQRAQKSLARDLEPLVHQVAKLKQVLSSDDEVGSENSASSYIDLGRRSRPVSPMPSNSTNKVDTTTTTSNQSSARLMAQKPGGGLTGPRRSSFDASAAMQEGGWTMSSRQTQQQNRNSSSSGYSGFLGRK